MHFDIPEGEYPMEPDKDDDEETAMATVNNDIEVGVNMPAIITATFVEGASPIGLVPGHNHPFEYVTWSAMQSMVVSTGVTFAVQPVEIGANQVPLPIGDATLITCGPFECMEGPTAPELSIANSAMCTGWDPTVEFQVGKVDNDVIDPDSGEEDTDGVNTNDGIDLGIVTSSTLAMKVKHTMSGVSGGTNSETTGDAAKGSNKTLAMKAITGVITIDADEDDTATAGIDEMQVCDNDYATEDVSAKADRPAGCFRLIGPGAMGRDDAKGPDYLAGWSIELSPEGGDVSWGDVEWDDDPSRISRAEPWIPSWSPTTWTSAGCSRLKWTSPPARAGSRTSCSGLTARPTRTRSSCGPPAPPRAAGKRCSRPCGSTTT